MRVAVGEAFPGNQDGRAESRERGAHLRADRPAVDLHLLADGVAELVDLDAEDADREGISPLGPGAPEVAARELRHRGRDLGRPEALADAELRPDERAAAAQELAIDVGILGRGALALPDDQPAAALDRG